MTDTATTEEQRVLETAALHNPGDLANLPEGGMGLFIMHSVMDQVEYSSHDGLDF